MMANRWIVTALGQDRPGIVAGVTQILYRLGCNLEDSAMTRLEGEFAIMLIFSAKPSQTEPLLRRAFAPLQRRLKLAVHLKRLTKAETASPKRRGHSYMISVYGADRPGIVYRLSAALAKRRVNINDVHTHRSRGRGPSLYMLLLEVEAPRTLPAQALETQLKRIGKPLGVQVSLRPSDASVL
jgi:glycine cleavage system transcriptional repressor